MDPYDPECPPTAPNYKSKEDPPVRKIISNGCTGFATDLQRWPNDLIVSKTEKNTNGEPELVFECL